MTRSTGSDPSSDCTWLTANTVGIIGAGVMGRGICIALCQAGLHVILVDVSDDILRRTRQNIEADLRAYSLLAAGRAPAPDEVFSRTTFTTDLNRLAEVKLVIENVTEKWETKKAVYEAIDRLCSDGTLFATNTSAIPVTRIASLTRRQSDVIGMHFMNPAPLKRTVELIRGRHTSEATISKARSFLAHIGKSTIIVNDSAGFVTNRVMMLTINEAIFLLQEQVATASDIDRLFVQAFGHRMGPLETADLIGLDTVLLSIEVIYDSFKLEKYQPCPLLRRMVEDGLHGRKTGQGFYSYKLDRQEGSK